MATAFGGATARGSLTGVVSAATAVGELPTVCSYRLTLVDPHFFRATAARRSLGRTAPAAVNDARRIVPHYARLPSIFFATHVKIPARPDAWTLLTPALFARGAAQVPPRVESQLTLRVFV